MKQKLIAFFLGLAALLLPRFTIAGPNSDCRDEYDSAREDCMLMHEDPDEADDLQMCLEDAKSAYEDCIEE